MSLRDVQNLFHHLCLDKKFVFNRQTLAKYVSEDNVNFLLGQNPKKQMVYRELVENNISSMIFTALPLTFHFLSATEKNVLIRDFLSEYQARSNHYRHIPYDFVEYVQRRKVFKNSEPGFLADLCDYEFCCYDLLFRNHKFKMPVSDFDKEVSEVRAVLNPHLVLKKYWFPVHEIKKNTAPHKIKKNNVDLILYRRVDNFEQTCLALNELTHSFIDILMRHSDKNFEFCLQLFLKNNSGFQKQTVVDEATAFLKELMDRQIVLALI